MRNGLGMAIVSTSKGVMTDREARQTRQGGELLAVDLVGGAMSRIGKKPIPIPKGVTVTVDGLTRDGQRTDAASSSRVVHRA